jgi:hypothetical protein
MVSPLTTLTADSERLPLIQDEISMAILPRPVRSGTNLNMRVPLGIRAQSGREKTIIGVRGELP